MVICVWCLNLPELSILSQKPTYSGFKVKPQKKKRKKKFYCLQHGYGGGYMDLKVS